MRRLLGEMSRKFQIKFKYPGEEGRERSSSDSIKPEFISKSGFRENWNLMNSDNISSRFLKSLTSDDLSSQDGTRSEGSWNGEDKIVRTNTSPLLAAEEIIN